MTSEFSTFISAIYPLSQEVQEVVLEHFQPMEYPKNFLLLRQGKPCNYIWFLTKGAVRYFYSDEEGKDHNVWFSIDRDILTDTPSFMHAKPAEVSIQLLEDCELFAIERKSIDMLLLKYHSFALWYIKLFEQYYVSQIEDRIGDLQFLTAKQRYEKLLIQFPSIGQRISLGHIASYLNITQETLSRIRAGKS
ncbi:MAG: Crp/Fnr family transcriptional regulator [Bacteroidetes bacterium]|nr:Crp/Fnr family transcriptional regulator [Bacteroidota bacterium]